MMKRVYQVSLPFYYQILKLPLGVHLAQLCQEHGIVMREHGKYKIEKTGSRATGTWEWLSFVGPCPNTRLRYFVSLYGLAQCVTGYNRYNKTFKTTNPYDEVIAWEWVFSKAIVEPPYSVLKYVKRRTRKLYEKWQFSSGSEQWLSTQATLKCLAQKGTIA